MGYRNPAQQAEYQRKWLADRRAAAIAEFGGKCSRCGSTEDLEFAHKERGTKTKQTGTRQAVNWGWSSERIAEELKLCILLCEVCHTEDTRQENTTPIVHGTWQAYKRTFNPCRCDECRAANAAYVHEWRVKATHVDGELVAR